MTHTVDLTSGLREDLATPLCNLKPHPLPYTENEVLYDRLTEKDIAKAADCLTKAYFSDPKTQICTRTEAIGYQRYYKNFLPMFLNICRAAATEDNPLSFIAKNQSDQVIGVLLTAECRSDSPETDHPFCSSPAPQEYEPVIEMIRQLDRAISEQYPEITTHKTLHLCNEGVLPEYRHREVGLNLGILCIEHAVANRYDYLIVETSTRATQYMLHKYIDFTVVAEINYKTFCYKGGYPFAHLADCPNELSCDSYKAMLKQLSHQ